ncbi:invasion associated locus B family protein [Celeribacter sp. ULVN23_4]
MMTTITRKLTALATAAACALSLAQPLAAQDSELSAGTPISTDNVGRPYTLETQGDWEIRCIKAPEGQPDPCSLYQLLKDENGTEVAEVTIFHVGQGNIEAAATFTTPLETLLTGQLALFVDGENGRKYPFQFCNKVGCFVRAGLTSEDIDLLKKGSEGMVGIVPVGRTDNPVTLTMSLSGFTAGYAKVTELNEAAKNGEGPSAPDAAPAE